MDATADSSMQPPKISLSLVHLGPMKNLQSLLPEVQYFDPERLSLLQRAYDAAWAGCTIEFRDQAKQDAARAYVVRAILKALQSSPHDFERAALVGKIAITRLCRLSRPLAT